MTNREKFILSRNEYDMLIEMNRNLRGVLKNLIGDRHRICILDVIDNSKCHMCESSCKACIQKWLNATPE